MNGRPRNSSALKSARSQRRGMSCTVATRVALVPSHDPVRLLSLLAGQCSPSVRLALFARSMRGSISARASSVRLRRRRRRCSTTPPARRGAQLRPATLLFALIVVCRSADGITLPLRVDGLRLGLGGRVTPDVFRLHACRPLAQESAVQWCLCQKQCAGQQMASSDAGRFVRSMSSSAHKQDEVGAA